MAVTLGEALRSAIAKGMIDFGEGAAATALSAGKLAKSAGTEAPASWRQGDAPLVEETTSRWEYAALTTRDAPSPAAYCHLVVDNGGGVRAGGGNRPDAYRSTAGRGRRSNLVVVAGRDHSAALSITGVSMRSRNS